MNWKGTVVVGGHFNESWSNSWISVPALFYGLDYVPPSSSGTRWDSARIIDFFLISERVEAHSWTHPVKISDHKLVVLEASLGWLEDEIGSIEMAQKVHNIATWRPGLKDPY